VGKRGVLVIGSANLDYLVKVAAPPVPGETVLARAMVKHPGGKGANQAIAAARMGARVKFLGCVGDDQDGEAILRELWAEGVDAAATEIVAHEQTGLALVSIFDSGENSITVVPGANFALQSARVLRGIAEDDSASAVIVLQAEVPSEIVETAVKAAGRARVVLNLAPYRWVPPVTLAACDPLVVNQSEAAALLGVQVSGPVAAARALDDLRGRVRSAVITLGAQGACWADRDGAGHVPAPAVDAVVDSTGAGDAFVGALAAELAAGSTLERATTVGVLAGTFAVGRFGAQSSYPVRADILPGLAEVEHSS
jgi:ribokinase